MEKHPHAEEPGQERHDHRLDYPKGIGTPATVKGATNGTTFEAYVELALCLSLSVGQVVEIDGLFRP